MDTTIVLQAVTEGCLALASSTAPPIRVLVPGRVNLIGEHTDYNGLPVMPIAIDRFLAVACQPTGDAQVRLVNVDPGVPPRIFELGEAIPPFPAGDWGNYAKAAAQALWGWAAAECPERLPLRGLCGCVGGTLPPGAGLSSSSALVVAIARALVAVNDLPIAPDALATLLAQGEQYVGTQGGGMDQAACLLSRAHMALRIDFAPLRLSPVPIPEAAVFIVAHSLVRAEKAGDARRAYNQRVAECRLGARLLRQVAGLAEALPPHPSLGQVMRACPAWPAALAALPPGALSLLQIADLLGESPAALLATDLAARDGSPLVSAETALWLGARCRHVLTEAQRVSEAEVALRAGDLPAFGRLMDASHASCAGDYAISCPELDTLVASLRRHGALGARLTGAGFGGCAIALTTPAHAPAVLAGVWADYYGAYARPHGLTVPAERETVLFACHPAAGATVVGV
jgi:N-acetylgalactosamine kinase